MTSLTYITQMTRKIIIFIVVGGVIFLFLYIIFNTFKNTFRPQSPPTAPVVSTVFGKLPRVKFPSQTFPSDIKFSIETIEGGISDASPTAKIYFIPKKQQSILSNTKASEDAKTLGFTLEGQNFEKKLLYRENNFEFIIDPITRNFSYKYNYQVDGSVFEGKQTFNSAVSEAAAFLDKLKALPKDFTTSRAITALSTYNGIDFIPVGKTETQNATSAKVNFFRNDLNNIKVVTPLFNQGNIYVIISKTDDKNKKIIEAKRNYFEISNDTIGIYPLKKGDEAWSDFLNGKGYIPQFGNSKVSKRVIIRGSYLAYYDSDEYQTYLLPVYVFLGDDNFVAYANAVSEDWLAP